MIHQSLAIIEGRTAMSNVKNQRVKKIHTVMHPFKKPFALNLYRLVSSFHPLLCCVTIVLVSSHFILLFSEDSIKEYRRSCGHFNADASKDDCIYKSTPPNVQNYFCETCATDGCNGAIQYGPTAAFVIVFVLKLGAFTYLI